MDYRVWVLSEREKFVFYLTVFCASSLCGWLFYNRLWLGIPIGVLLMPLRKKYVDMLMDRRKNKLLLQFRDLLYSVSALISAGRSLGQSIEGSIEFWKGTYGEKDLIMAEIADMTVRMREGGERDVDVLRDFAVRSDIEDVWDLVMVCDTCKRTGGNFARAIVRCADMTGDKISLERELAALTGQKRFEGRIVGISPFVIIFFVKIMSPEYLAVLSETSSGRMICAIALGLIAYSIVLIERMNKIEI